MNELLKLIRNGEDQMIEFFNLGKFFEDITIEKLLSRNYSSRTRNRAVAKMFKEAGIIEKYGPGIKRIKKACQLHGISDPIFEEFQHGFRVILNKKKTDEGISEGINEGINLLLEYIETHPAQRVSQIETELNIPAKTLERWIKQLKENEKIEYRGSKKTGGYYVK